MNKYIFVYKTDTRDKILMGKGYVPINEAMRSGWKVIEEHGGQSTVWFDGDTDCRYLGVKVEF